jgi:cell division protein ZapA (FtsZ GTPase activity inhibitor)
MGKIIAEKYSRGLLDFHTHSIHSDGGDTPTDLVRRAKEKGVSALALTDHHNTGGLEEFNRACQVYDVFGIPFGAEISAELPSSVLTPADNEAPDLVLLGMNPNIAPFKRYQEIYFDYMERVFLPETLAKLRQEGFEIPKNIDIHAQCANMHCPPDILMDFTKISNNLDRLVNYVRERNPKISEDEIRKKPFGAAVNALYSVGCPAYVQRMAGFNVDDALELAEEMKCGLIIAHPGGDFGALTPEILNYYFSKGVRFMEARNYFNSQVQNNYFDSLVKQHKLVRSGGSDYHGDLKRPQLGMSDRPQNQLPKQILEELVGNLSN